MWKETRNFWANAKSTDEMMQYGRTPEMEIKMRIKCAENSNREIHFIMEETLGPAAMLRNQHKFVKIPRIFELKSSEKMKIKCTKNVCVKAPAMKKQRN